MPDDRPDAALREVPPDRPASSAFAMSPTPSPDARAPEPLDIADPTPVHDAGPEASPDARHEPPVEDGALATRLGDTLHQVAGNPALDHPAYLAWLAEELAHAARRAARRTSDATFLHQGRALLAAVQARQTGIVRDRGRAPLECAPLHGAPRTVLRAALAAGAAPLVELAVAAGAGRELWDEPSDAWVRLPAGTPPGRYLALRIRGDSMVPLLQSGDTVLVHLDGVVEPGVVVIARHPDDGYVCKRVRRVRATRLELDSLAPDGPAFVLPRDGRLVLGTVVRVWGASPQGVD